MSFCIAPSTSELRADDREGADRRRVLFVTPYLPSPPRFGGQRRLDGLIATLAREDDVSVLSLVDAEQEDGASFETTRAYCRRVVTVPAPSGAVRKRAVQALSLASGRSYEWHAYARPTLAAALSSVLARDAYDVVQFEFPYTAFLAPRRGPGSPIFVLDAHNVEFDIGRQTAQSGGLARRAYNAANWPKLRGEERRVWEQVDGCAVTSTDDEATLRGLVPGARTATVPNGVDVAAFEPIDAPVERDAMLFFGALDYYPNIDGLLFFLERILPRIRVRRPSCRLSIVGRRPPPSIASRGGCGVELTGAVADVRPHIARAGVVVVPLRLGGGTRLKILEAMAMGKPVVSTSIGACGIEAVPGRDLIIADDPDAFARAVADLLADPGHAAHLGANARRYVEAHHGWSSSVATLRAFHRDLIASRCSLRGAA